MPISMDIRNNILDSIATNLAYAVIVEDPTSTIELGNDIYGSSKRVPNYTTSGIALDWNPSANGTTLFISNSATNGNALNFSVTQGFTPNRIILYENASTIDTVRAIIDGVTFPSYASNEGPCYIRDISIVLTEV